jgi:Zn-finger nucleic acid-binding protein
MNCPKCRVALKMYVRQGIEINYCPLCRGVWLDRSELDLIIGHSVMHKGKSNFNPHNNMSDSNDFKREDYYMHNKKGWMGDLFD